MVDTGAKPNIVVRTLAGLAAQKGYSKQGLQTFFYLLMVPCILHMIWLGRGVIGEPKESHKHWCQLLHVDACSHTHRRAQRCPGPKLISICCWWWQCDTWHDWAKGSLVSWGKALLHRTSGAQALMHSGALSCVHPSTLSQGTVRPSTLTGLDSSQNALSYPKTCAPCTGSQRDFSCNFCSIWWLFLWQNWIFWKLWFLRNRVISEHAKGI